MNYNNSEFLQFRIWDTVNGTFVFRYDYVTFNVYRIPNTKLQKLPNKYKIFSQIKIILTSKDYIFIDVSSFICTNFHSNRLCLNKHDGVKKCSEFEAYERGLLDTLCT